MRTDPILQAARTRLRPGNALAMLAVMSLVSLVRIFLGEISAIQELPHWGLGSLLVAALIGLSPMPWQWTGDLRRMAPPLRGLGQALVWDGLWLLLLMLAMAPFRPAHIRAMDPGLHPWVAHLTRTLTSAIQLQKALAPLVGLLPLALGTGWLLARFQAVDADRAEAVEGRRVMEIAAREAQEQALKAQLDPHVLYNALGGISELIREDPARAEQALLSLAELYRKLTALGRRAEVALGEERALVADYLAVEQVRLGERLQVVWTWSEDLDSRPVPPLLIQPLVENAIKHGIAASRRGGTLRISAGADGAGIRIQVGDDGVALDPGWQPGIGLSNLTQRLALLGGGSRFELRSDGPWTLAELWLGPGGRP